MAVFVVVRDQQGRITGVIKRNATVTELGQQVFALLPARRGARGLLEVIRGISDDQRSPATYSLLDFDLEVRNAPYLTEQQRLELLRVIDLPPALGTIRDREGQPLLIPILEDGVPNPREVAFIVIDDAGPQLVIASKYIDP